MTVVQATFLSLTRCVQPGKTAVASACGRFASGGDAPSAAVRRHRSCPIPGTTTSTLTSVGVAELLGDRSGVDAGRDHVAGAGVSEVVDVTCGSPARRVAGLKCLCMKLWGSQAWPSDEGKSSRSAFGVLADSHRLRAGPCRLSG